jgi:hypothetical protein
MIEKAGRRAPQGPTPPLNSFQIALKIPKGVALAGEAGSMLTASSVEVMAIERSYLTKN